MGWVSHCFLMFDYYFATIWRFLKEMRFGLGLSAKLY